MSNEDDRDRAAILARRRRWIAIALAGAATTACSSAQPCLSFASPDDAGVDASDAETDASDGD